MDYLARYTEGRGHVTHLVGCLTDTHGFSETNTTNTARQAIIYPPVLDFPSTIGFDIDIVRDNLDLIGRLFSEEVSEYCTYSWGHSTVRQ